MARMVRKQVYITAEQESAIKELSARTGVKEAAIIREGIELALSDERVLERRVAAFERAETVAEQVLALGPVDRKGRGWSRGELYDR